MSEEKGAAPLPELVLPKENEYGEQNNANDSNLDDDSTRSVPGFSSNLRTSDEGKLDEEKTLDHLGTGSGSGGNSGAGDAPGDGPKLAELPDGGGAAVVVDEAENSPHVAEETVPHVASKNVLPFATRGTVKPKKQKRKRATRGKSRPVVEAGKGSKGTWQIRLRWNSEPGRPVEYVATITDTVYDLIRNGDYEGYKQQTIASYEARSLSARNTA